MEETIRKQGVIEVLKETSEGSYEIVISTDAPDRDGDIIEQDGWELDHYLRNPVVMFAHDYASVPIGITTALRPEAGKLVATFKFREPANEFDPVLPIKAAWDQGVLRAASVGFRVKESAALSEDDEGWFFGPRRFLKQELLEWSIVPIPANQEALRRGYAAFVKSLGDPTHSPVGVEWHLPPAAPPSSLSSEEATPEQPAAPDTTTDSELSAETRAALVTLLTVIRSIYMRT